MDTKTHPTSRLAVIYDAAAGPNVYRIAIDLAAKAWDAGCGVRVRRVGELIEPDASGVHGDWAEMLEMLETLGDAAQIPEVCAADLEWATVTLVLAAPRSGQPARAASHFWPGSWRQALH
jgi:hypothetical protein